MAEEVGDADLVVDLVVGLVADLATVVVVVGLVGVVGVEIGAEGDEEGVPGQVVLHNLKARRLLSD